MWVAASRAAAGCPSQVIKEVVRGVQGGPRRRTFFAQEPYHGPPAGLPGRPVSKTTVASQNRVGQLHPYRKGLFLV